MDLQTVKNFWTKYLNMLGNQFDIDLYLFNQSLIAFSSLETDVSYHKDNISYHCIQCILNHYTKQEIVSPPICINRVYPIPLPPELHCLLIIKFNNYIILENDTLTNSLISTENRDKIEYITQNIEFLINNIFPMIILNQNGKLLSENVPSPFLKEDNSNLSKEIIFVIANEIQTAPEKDYSLETLSNTYHISQSYLSTKFREYIGISLKKFIIKHRINKSKQLLSTTNLTIEEIAIKSGFSDSSYFHKIFKKETGHTPLKFKQQ